MTAWYSPTVSQARSPLVQCMPHRWTGADTYIDRKKCLPLRRAHRHFARDRMIGARVRAISQGRMQTPVGKYSQAFCEDPECASPAPRVMDAAETG
jgi:hypothetical protein